MIGWSKEPAVGDTDHLRCLSVALIPTPHSDRVKQPHTHTAAVGHKLGQFFVMNSAR